MGVVRDLVLDIVELEVGRTNASLVPKNNEKAQSPKPNTGRFLRLDMIGSVDC